MISLLLCSIVSELIFKKACSNFLNQNRIFKTSAFVVRDYFLVCVVKVLTIFRLSPESILILHLKHGVLLQVPESLWL